MSRMYVDLFAGCGGLSLGLGNAGWKGYFAVERDGMAFETFKQNLIDECSPYAHFPDWPAWVPVEPIDIKEFLANGINRKRIKALKGNIPLLVGGPPCQGFSVGGARRGHDERNQLVFDYLDFASLLMPDMIVIENVEGMARAFKSVPGAHNASVLSVVLDELRRLGYTANYFIAKATDAGVPQDRRRVITFGIRRELFDGLDPARLLEAAYKKAGVELRASIGLPVDRPVTIGEAIDDLSGDDLVTCPDAPKFQTAKYASANSQYQKYMRRGARKGSVPNSHRFSKHGPKVGTLYKTALATQEPGRLSREFLLENNTKTQKKFLLGRNLVASTLTTHPDEHIHYKHPRNVSLREMARLQSFPDDFHFFGRYTLNGERRKLDVSRCAQIGNAVPVLMGQALGMALKYIYEILQEPDTNDVIFEMLNEKIRGENLEMVF